MRVARSNLDKGRGQKHRSVGERQAGRLRYFASSSESGPGSSASSSANPASSATSSANSGSPNSQRPLGGPTSTVVSSDGPVFLDWTNRLGNLESIIDLPDARAALSRARRAAREMRITYRESGNPPQPEIVISQVLGPLLEAQGRIAMELADLKKSDPLAPVERDPVPETYAEVVRRYYEDLGR